jgi:hypothetical protein
LKKKIWCLPCAGNCLPPVGGAPSLILSAVWTSSSNCGFFCSSSRKTFYGEKKEKEGKILITMNTNQVECERKKEEEKKTRL